MHLVKRLPPSLLIVLACWPGSAARAEEPAPVSYWPTAALRVSSPLGVTGSLGVVRTRRPADPQFCKYEVGGLSAQVEAGSGGGQVSLGLAILCSEKRWIHFTPKGFAMAASVRATYVRTWGQPWGGAEPGTSYLGAYVELGPPIVSGRIGVLKPVGLPPGRDAGPILYFGGAVGF
jgi:hypothetical protein